MSSESRFSERGGYQAGEAEITIQEDAPSELRGVLVDMAYEAGLSPGRMRTLVCRVLRRREDPDNWSPFPNIDNEVREHLDACQWFEVYDVAEEIYAVLKKSAQRRPRADPLPWDDEPPSIESADESTGAVLFAKELNQYFRRRGIGWQLVDGQLRIRGSKNFETAVNEAKRKLLGADRPTTARELEQALADLSRRPAPDLTGAIQHALAALECVARDVTGRTADTLGPILNGEPDLFPPPLNAALAKIWGFACERGRHLREARDPDHDEVMLVVHVAAAAAAYLASKPKLTSPKRSRE